MNTKVWDIVVPKTKWDKLYAKMEWQRIMWHDLWSATTHIEVVYEPGQSILDVIELEATNCEWAADTGQVCNSQDYPEMCASCLEAFADLQASIAEDRAIQDA